MLVKGTIVFEEKNGISIGRATYDLIQPLLFGVCDGNGAINNFVYNVSQNVASYISESFLKNSNQDIKLLLQNINQGLLKKRSIK